MIKFTISGIDRVERRLKDLSRRAQELHGQHSVLFSELMSPEFISNCSRFSSLEELFSASNFKIESMEDFKAIPDEEWDTFIRNNTSYSSWEEMQHDAAKIWTANQLGLG